MRKIIILTIYILISCNVYSQTANIKVFDGETKKAMPYVSVWIGDEKGNNIKCYPTDKQGEARKAVASKSVITIKYVGYKSITDTIYPNDNKTYYMTPDVFNLEQVVITGTRTDKTLKDSPVITQVITAHEIENRGVSDIRDLLSQELPGINFQQSGFGTSMSLQGLDAKNVLFLIDGERMAGETDGNIDYSRINLYNVERIEIVKGAASAIYGSQAMGGVINIITKDAQKKVELDLGMRYAEKNQQNYEDISKNDRQYKYKTSIDEPNLNANISFGLNLGKLKAYTDVLYKSTDGYQLYNRDSLTKYFPEYDTTIVEPLNTIPTSISGSQDWNISQKISYQFDDKFSVAARANYYELNEFDFAQDNKYENDVDFNYGASLDYNINKESNILLSYYADNYKRYNALELLDREDLTYQNDIMQPKAIFNTKAFKNQAITAGFEYFYESLYGDRFATNMIETKEQWSATFFAQDDWSFMENYNVVAGLRLDYHGTYGFNASPKLSFMYKTSPVTLRLNYAQGYRSPSLKELYMDWDHMGMFWLYGNENLQPETNNYFSVSAEHTSSWIYLVATAYGNWFKNKIEGVWTDDQTEYHYANMGKTTLAGVEGAVKIKLIQGLFLYANIDYMYEYAMEDVNVTAISPLSGNLRLKYSFIRPNYDLNASIIGCVTGNKDYAVLDEITINGEKKGAYYNAHVDMFSTWNFSLTQRFYDVVRLTLGVDNIFDYTAPIINFNTSSSPGRRFYAAINFDIDNIIEKW